VEIHDMVDLLEKQIAEKMHIPITLHMDPIVTEDEFTNKIKERVSEIVYALSSQLSIHDFRMVPGKTHTNLIFDIAVPCDFPLSNDDIRKIIENDLAKSYTIRYFLVIQFDRSFL